VRSSGSQKGLWLVLAIPLLASAVSAASSSIEDAFGKSAERCREHFRLTR